MASAQSRYAEDKAGLAGLLADFVFDYFRWLALVRPASPKSGLNSTH